jgi:hypothetical protein
MEEEQRTKWTKEIGQKETQRSTKHTHQTKDWVTRIYLILEKNLCSNTCLVIAKRL